MVQALRLQIQGGVEIIQGLLVVTQAISDMSTNLVIMSVARLQLYGSVEIR
jgi:hypothetical protein